MGTTTRLCLGVVLLGALGLGLFLFVSGRITFPSTPQAGRFTGDGAAGFGYVWSASSMKPAAEGVDGDQTGIPPLSREAEALHVSRNGRHGLLVARPPVLWHSEYHGDHLGASVFVLFGAPPGSTLTPWQAPGWKNGKAPPQQPPLHEFIGQCSVREQGRLSLWLGDVRVLDDGGYVLVSVDAGGLSGDGGQGGVVRFDEHGAFVWGRTPATLLGEDARLMAALDDPLSRLDGIAWQQGMWVDESRGVVVIVGLNDELYVLSLADGRTVQRADAIELIKAALTDGVAEDRALAFQLARRCGWAETIIPPETAFADTSASDRVRLWAASVLASRGDFTGAAFVSDVARRSMQPDAVASADAELAWRSLGTCLGAASIPQYLERLRMPAHEHLASIEAEVDGLASLGELAIEPAIQLWLALPNGSSLSSRYERLLAVLRSGSPAEPTPRNTGNGAAWDRLRRTEAVEVLAALLRNRPDVPGADAWSLLVLPAARWARLHPRPEYADPLGAFRAAFAVEPQCRDGWRDRVLAETDAALAACSGN